MSLSLRVIPPAALSDAVSQLAEATAAKKCWGCGCFHNSLDSIERAFPADERPAELDIASRAARGRLTPIQYDCLGCEVCWPPQAMNALDIDGDACPSDQPEARTGWPPLPGRYSTHRYLAPVAVCTLTDERLAAELAQRADDSIAIVGSVYTENLGLERIIANLIANLNIRFLLVCGSDSRQAIGHLPGQSLVALGQSGVDQKMRIIGARGRRPVLKNLTREIVEHFRQTIEVIDMIGESDVSRILDAAKQCAERNPGPAEAPPSVRAIESLLGYIPQRMTSDPNGYFVVYSDSTRGVLLLEHYRNDGGLDIVIEGRSAAELYIPAVDRKLVSRLDHAAYLGRELARAEHALHSGEPFVQDAAPERGGPPTSAVCGCGSGSKCPVQEP